MDCMLVWCQLNANGCGCVSPRCGFAVTGDLVGCGLLFRKFRGMLQRVILARRHLTVGLRLVLLCIGLNANGVRNDDGSCLNFTHVLACWSFGMPATAHLTAALACSHFAASLLPSCLLAHSCAYV